MWRCDKVSLVSAACPVLSNDYMVQSGRGRIFREKNLERALNFHGFLFRDPNQVTKLKSQLPLLNHRYPSQNAFSVAPRCIS